MSAKIELTIPKTSSSNLSKVLRGARVFESFTEPTEKDQLYILVVEPEELRSRHRDLEQLYMMARSWKGTQLRINDRLGDINDLKATFTVFQCADKRETAVFTDNFCQPDHENGWGCQRLTMIGRGLPQYFYELNKGYSYWFQFGSFNEGRTAWHVDKKKLLDALNREVSLRYLDMCPYFIVANIEERVNALPDLIDLGDDSSWVVQFEERCDNSTIQKVPAGIIPKDVGRDRDNDLSGALSTQADKEEQYNRNIPKVSFNDIGGVDDMIGMVREVIELPLRHPALFKHLGISPHKGILLYGPPGCGKTLIAKAIANEIQAHFISR